MNLLLKLRASPLILIVLCRPSTTILCTCDCFQGKLFTLLMQLMEIHLKPNLYFFLQIHLHNLTPSSLIAIQLIPSSSLGKPLGDSLAVFINSTILKLVSFECTDLWLQKNSSFENAISHFNYVLGLDVKQLSVTYISSPKFSLESL